MKYWNQRRTAPVVPSYLFECLLLNAFESSSSEASENIGLEVGKALAHIQSGIYTPVRDPKMIEGDLNVLTLDQRRKVSQRAGDDVDRVVAALESEFDHNDHEKAIGIWGSVFGPSFPQYG